MITLFFSPQWFYGIDIIFEILAIIVTLIISFYSFKLHRYTHQRAHKYFSASFLAIAIAFAAKIMTNFALYYQHAVKTTFEDVIVRYNLLTRSNLFFEAGLDIYRFLFLLGLFGIYWLVSKSKDNEHRWFFAYLILVITLFSFQTYYLFHLTAAILLLFIMTHFHRICLNCRKKAQPYAQTNFAAFSLLFMSQIVFIFNALNPAIYVIAESVQLLGFVVFLTNIFRLVFYNGKTKNKN